MAHIISIAGRVIRDSRDEDTVACRMALDDGTSVTASVPRGKSVGSREAATASAAAASAALGNEITRLLVGADPAEGRAVDEILIQAAGENKKLLGANATLAASVAAARAAAISSREPLWQYIQRLAGDPHPAASLRLLVNVVNGGVHAKGSTLFQEHLIMPREADLAVALTRAERAYERIGDFIRSRMP